MGSHNAMRSSGLEGAGNMLIPPIRRASPGSCLHCYSLGSDNAPLLRCSQCKLVSYCTKHCQKRDWPVHKPFCLANKVIDGENIFSKLSNQDSLYKFSVSQVERCSGILKRPLKQFEKDILFFPKVCSVCLDSKSNLFITCIRCCCVFYCSESHQEDDRNNHNKWCLSYLFNLQCHAYESLRGIQDLPLPLDVDKEYIPLETDLKTYLKDQLKPNDGSILDHEVELIIYERLSYSFSLLYALQKIFVTDPALNDLHELKVCIVGATSLNEMLGIIRWEYVMHRLPSLKLFHVVFIGPELYKDVEADEDIGAEKHGLDDSGITRCSDCQSNERMIVYEMANMTYHEFAESMRYSKPDVIISYNPNFGQSSDKEEANWISSLEFILSSGVPFIITSYTKSDSQKDLKLIDKISKDYTTIFSPEYNPYCSLRPIRNPSWKENCPLFYCNQFISCIKGKE